MPVDSSVADNSIAHSPTEVQSRRKRTPIAAPAAQDKIRAELNIEKWPAMWQPSKSKTKVSVRTFSREVTFSDGSRGTAQLEVGFTQFGTVTTEDQRMFYALVKQWEDNGKPTAQVFFSDRLLARMLKKSWGTNVIDAITGSLRRLRLTPFRWIKSYHRGDSPKKEVEEEVPFTLLSDLKIIKRKTDGHVTNQQGYFQFDRNLLESLQSNYTKPLLLDVFFKLKSEIGQLIYSHVDLIMANKTRYERCTKELFQDLGLAQLTYYRHPSHRKQALKKTLEELQGVQLSTGVLKRVTLERTKDGKDYKVVFQKGAYTASADEITDPMALGEPGATTVVNNYAKTKDPLVAQGEEIVTHFHRRIHGVENHYPQPKEIGQAISLITQHGVEKTRFLIDYAADSAGDTNFKMQHFGGILAYTSRALASFDGRKARNPARSVPTVSAQPEFTEVTSGGESRLLLLTSEQYARRFEKAKADLLQQNRFLARHWKDGHEGQEKIVRARIIRELGAEPMSLLILDGQTDPEAVRRKLGLQNSAL